MTETSWHSYPKVFAIGHRSIDGIFDGEVEVEEKVDGSQFSFGRFGAELKLRSRGKVFPIDAPEKMFNKACETVAALAEGPQLKDGYTYRGEYLEKPSHNSLAYDRTPKQHIILWDIATGLERYMSYEEKKVEAERLGLEIVPLLFKGTITNPQMLIDLSNQTSILGGQQMEGVVVKNHAKFGLDGKPLIGKYVTERFKETHHKVWTSKDENKSVGDIVEKVASQYRTEARWHKAVQHLKERGELEHSPSDIGKLINEVKKDIDEECADEIKNQLYKYALSKIQRVAVHGVPEWYKEQLLRDSFR